MQYNTTEQHKEPFAIAIARASFLLVECPNISPFSFLMAPAQAHAFLPVPMVVHSVIGFEIYRTYIIWVM